MRRPTRNPTRTNEKRQITVVVSGRNTGSKPMNLSAVVGSINSPEKFDMYIQNFTVAVSRVGCGCRGAAARMEESEEEQQCGAAAAGGGAAERMEWMEVQRQQRRVHAGQEAQCSAAPGGGRCAEQRKLLLGAAQAPVAADGTCRGTPLKSTQLQRTPTTPTTPTTHRQQNKQRQRYFAPLAPGAEASIEYKFRADPILGATPPREWAVALHVLYEVSGEYFSSTFFNQTVEFAERPRLVDTDLLWLAATLLALAGAGGEPRSVCPAEGGGGRGRVCLFVWRCVGKRGGCCGVCWGAQLPACSGGAGKGQVSRVRPRAKKGAARGPRGGGSRGLGPPGPGAAPPPPTFLRPGPPLLPCCCRARQRRPLLICIPTSPIPSLLPPPHHHHQTVYFGWKTVADRLGIKTKGARAPRRDAGAAAAAAPLDEDEWVKGTHYEVQKRRRAAAARKA